MKADGKNRIPGFWLTALLWGSLWGLAEASAGYLLHLLLIPGFSGYLMFPMGFFLMMKAFKQRKTYSVIFCTALVAANIKLVDIFIPGSAPAAVFNPAAAIILESLAVVGLLYFIKRTPERYSMFSLYFAAFSWRSAYFCLAAAAGVLFSAENFITMGSILSLRFLFLDSLVDALLIRAFINKDLPIINSTVRMNIPSRVVLTFLLAAAAIVMEILV
jgi:hypothetical protein